MTITLNLSPQLEEKLNDAAKQRGVTIEEHAIEILHQNLPHTPQQRAESYRAWLQQVRHDGDAEGDCTWDEVLQRIDEARGEGRKLFPPEMKGISW